MPTTSPTRNERGHLLECSFIDNHGPSCACDGDEPLDTIGLRFVGWSRNKSGLSFSRSFAGHSISIYRAVGGWGYVWSTTRGMTVREDSGYGTASHCLDALWNHVGETYDRYIELCMAQIPS